MPSGQDVRAGAGTGLVCALALAFVPLHAAPVLAQDTQPADTAGAADAADSQDQDSPDELLTPAELQTLVAPVALYPDTLLIQILVGATAPLDIVKADRVLTDNDSLSEDEIKPLIEDQQFDESVEVLSVAFPDVVHRMADHIDWTDTVGTAMLAQSEDVLDAVQVMRDQAIDSGALVDTPEQVVSRDEATDSVIIQPANPQVVYVPQYDPQVVYAGYGGNVGVGIGDALVAGAVTFGAIALIDEIFDDDDHWNDYWGCRHCGGWGGGPIIRDPDIDIDLDIDRGDINIDRGDIDLGNRLDIDRGDVDLGNRLNIDRDKGWKPDPDRTRDAKDKIAARRDVTTGKTRLPLEQKARDRDALRDRLSAQTGAKDISRPGNRADIGKAVAGGGGPKRPGGGGAKLPGDRSKVLKAKGPGKADIHRPKGKNAPKLAKPSSGGQKISKTGGGKPKLSKRAGGKPKIAPHSSGARAKAASHRGGGARAKARGGRR